MGYELFLAQIPAVLNKYPKLFQIERDGKSILAGEIDVVDRNDKFWETYNVEIFCSDGFPNRFPNLYEVGGKIPKIADWHIYEDTLSCCVKILPEEILRCIKGISLEQYVTEVVLPYLFNQTHRKVEGYYVNGEYSHGSLGFYEYYSQLLKTGNLTQIARLLHGIATILKPDRTSLCFCGSGIKYRYCHRKSYEKLAPLGTELLIEHAVKFYNISNKL
ncbi:SEC-C motif-containing protein [Mucilaginibacter sp. OK283]|nr:SEC-C motif-containing protein [Mucilaginibacter sp. OK283]